jgi:hypothetical protein
MLSFCRHIKTNGIVCKAVALTDRPYCYYHDRLHRVLNNRRSARKKSLVLPPLEDRESVFLALSDVIRGLAAGRIETKNATQLIYSLQMAGKFAPENPGPVAGDDANAA